MLWALSDHLGSVRDLVDNTGTVQNHKSYDAFGNVTSGASAVDTAFGYTGKLFDDATGLQNNLNRWYDPKVGRWLSEDPIGFDAGDANLYRYVGNAPTQYTDPDGLEESSWSSNTGSGMARRRGALIEAGGLNAAGPLHRSARFAGQLPGAVLDHAEAVAMEALLFAIPGPADNYAAAGYRTQRIARHGANAADAFVIGRRAGTVVGKETLKQLELRLLKKRVILKNADEMLDKRGAGGLFRPYKDGSATIYLRSNPTKYEIAHELRHYQHFCDVGMEGWQKLSPLAREQHVYDSLRRSHRWTEFTKEEIKHAKDYLRKLGGDPW